MLTFTTKDKFDDLERLIDRIVNMGNAEKRKIAGGVTKAFQENFSTEGAASGNPWRPLAPRTVATRRLLDWPGSRPILKRSGNYESSFVNSSNGNHIEEITRSGSGLIFDVGSRLAFRIHERGGVVSIPSLQLARGGGMRHVGGARNVFVPKRSVLELGEQQATGLVRLIDFALIEIEKREWR